MILKNTQIQFEKYAVSMGMNGDGQTEPNGLNWTSELDGTERQMKVDGWNYDNNSTTERFMFVSSTTMVCRREEIFPFFLDGG